MNRRSFLASIASMKIHVVVPTYNCMQFLPRCLDSIRDQTRKADTVVIVDDASTDLLQAKFIEDYCHRMFRGWFAIINKTNLEAAHNIWNAILDLNPDPDDVIVEVDGDDFLTPNCLERIAAEYADPDVWLTYGSYRYHPNPNHWNNPALPYPPEVIAANSYRTHPVHFNHPETWRAFVWRRLYEADLQDNQGQWIRRTWDNAAMMPLLELAGKHHRFIREQIYIYNHENQASHVRIAEHKRQAEAEARDICGRPAKEPIPDCHTNPRRKRDMLLRMRDKHDICTLVETGTGMGDGIDWVYRHFDSVFSIEIDPASFEQATKRHVASGARFICGDSAVELPKVIEKIRRPAIFFLDGHWSGGPGVHGPKDTPVVEELQAIFAGDTKNVVVIDDARLFGTDPAYPTVQEVDQMAWPSRRVYVEDDMIVIEPGSNP